MRKMLIVGAMAFAIASGTAIAGALDVTDNIAPFYTDASMKTLKSPAEMKVAWDATPMETRKAMMKECQDAAMSKPHAEFCADLMALGGANK